MGGLTDVRTRSADRELRESVAELWGSQHRQLAPQIYYEVLEGETAEDRPSNQGIGTGQDASPAFNPDFNPDRGASPPEETQPLPPTRRSDLEASKGNIPVKRVFTVPEQSDIQVDLRLDQRKKGLLWYNTYFVGFDGRYLIMNPTREAREFTIEFTFPTGQAVYDNFNFTIGDEAVPAADAKNGTLTVPVLIRPGEQKPLRIAYDSRGLDRWYYALGEGVTQVKNFRLEMTTDFRDIDFPGRTISPTTKEKTETGWRLVWDHENLISGFELGLEMPRKLNPGPLASRISFFAPVSLLFFFFVIFIFSVLKNLKIHPMNYFFLAAAFFAFHLLFAYLVDHLNVHLSFIISSLVSIGLVVSYLRLVVGPRFAFLEAGLAQLVYLVLFSYTHFFKGYTGLTVTIGAVITLFVVMQATARIDWEEYFSS